MACCFDSRHWQEFYIPLQSSSIHFLRTRLCVGCANGFEIVDLETLDTQGLIDPSDASLDFVRKREGLRPIAIFRIGNEFLLCYDGEHITAYLALFEADLL
jgi:RHO1 GDP-GTP exchange protein 1/2